jgi:hypothetical protein
MLSHDGRAEAPVTVGFSIEPNGDYTAASAEIELLKNQHLSTSRVSTTRSGEGTVTIERGYPFDITALNQARLVLNRGTLAEIKSDPVRVPLQQGIIVRFGAGGLEYTPDSKPIQVFQEVDVVNNRMCLGGTELFFELSREADVTLVFQKIDETITEIRVLNEERFPEGEHRTPLTPAELPPGRYRVLLTATGTADGAVETRQATAISSYRSRDSLPIGHAMLEGVDLWDGHLVVSREDLSLPGRGVPLRFNRTYSSNAPWEPGALGVGWVHSYESSLQVTSCGEIIISGGEGSGMRFVDDGAGNLKPLKGHHGTLIANNDDYSFDFFSKSGNRFHYDHLRLSQWYLSFIEDTNGNRTELLYSGDPVTWRLSAVVDSAGRMLRLSYEQRQFDFGSGTIWTGFVITRVDGPDGMGRHGRDL